VGRILLLLVVLLLLLCCVVVGEVGVGWVVYWCMSLLLQALAVHRSKSVTLLFCANLPTLRPWAVGTAGPSSLPLPWPRGLVFLPWVVDWVVECCCGFFLLSAIVSWWL